jgi:hypothetical protein
MGERRKKPFFYYSYFFWKVKIFNSYQREEINKNFNKSFIIAAIK